MEDSKITVNQLAEELVAHDAPYTEINAFADDVVEIHDLNDEKFVPMLRPFDATGETFAFENDGQSFVLRILKNGGARVTRSTKPIGVPKAADAVGPAAGTAIAAAMAKKGEGWATGMILGILAGPAISKAAKTPRRARRVFTMEYDSNDKKWWFYDGPLVSWLKSELPSI